MSGHTELKPFGYLLEKAGVNNGYYFVSPAEYEHVEERFQSLYKPVYDAPPPNSHADLVRALDAISRLECGPLRLARDIASEALATLTARKVG